MTEGASIAALGGRLMDPKDRESYAALLSYADSLPEDDEFRRLTQLLGLHTLLTQRVPDAISELIAELKLLPDRVTVDATEIAAKVGETFRKQSAVPGLEQTAVQLHDTAGQIRGVTEQVQASLELISQRHKSVTTSIAMEVARLETASSQLQRQNARLIVQTQQKFWWWKSLVVVVVFLAGVLCGIVYEQDQKPECPAVVSVPVQEQNPPAIRTAPQRRDIRGLRRTAALWGR